VEEVLSDDNFTGNYVVVKYTDKDTGQLKKLEIRAEVKAFQETLQKSWIKGENVSAVEGS
jgi:hypothetical protein